MIRYINILCLQVDQLDTFLIIGQNIREFVRPSYFHHLYNPFANMSADSEAQGTLEVQLKPRLSRLTMVAMTFAILK